MISKGRPTDVSRMGKNIVSQGWRPTREEYVWHGTSLGAPGHDMLSWAGPTSDMGDPV